MDWCLNLCYWLFEGWRGGGGVLLFYKFFVELGWLALEFLGDNFFFYLISKYFFLLFFNFFIIFFCFVVELYY